MLFSAGTGGETPLNATEAFKIWIKSSLVCFSSKLANAPRVKLKRTFTCQYVGDAEVNVLFRRSALEPIVKKFVQI